MSIQDEAPLVLWWYVMLWDVVTYHQSSVKPSTHGIGWAAPMHLNLDGAGRSSTLARLPKAKVTVSLPLSFWIRGLAGFSKGLVGVVLGSRASFASEFPVR